MNEHIEALNQDRIYSREIDKDPNPVAPPSMAAKTPANHPGKKRGRL
jgi:hypothetical protein